MDPDYLVLALFLAGTVLGFMWRRTGRAPWKWAWLAAMWIEVEFRKWRDRKGGGRNI